MAPDDEQKKSEAGLRDLLLKIQKTDSYAHGVMEQLRRNMDRSRSTRLPDQPDEAIPLPSIDANTIKTFRLNPMDGILEKQVQVPGTSFWAPYMPVGRLELGGESLPWRMWIYSQIHQQRSHPTFA